MKKTIELTLKEARSIYKDAEPSVRRILEANFGKQIMPRPIGVWCLTKDKKAIKPKDWNDGCKPLGVGVITEDTSFIVHLEPQAAVPFGSTDVKKYAGIVYDTETYDNRSATSAISLAHDGVRGKMWNNDKFPFEGSPATAYCAKCGGDLPTLATAKVIAEHIKDINEAMLSMGGSVVCGWLWTSTVKPDNNCAFVVDPYYGNVGNGCRIDDYPARSVSAFHFEDFEF
jgi:hypothetical protein